MSSVTQERSGGEDFTAGKGYSTSNEARQGIRGSAGEGRSSEMTGALRSGRSPDLDTTQ